MPPQNMVLHAACGLGHRRDLLDAAAQLAEAPGRPRARRRHLGIHHLGEAEIGRPRHPQPLHAALERLDVVDARAGQRERIARVGPRAAFIISAASATVRVIGPMWERPHAALNG